jgi:hypothetical protein
MSIFASQTKQTIALPFALPHTITIRKLTGREYEGAQQAAINIFQLGEARPRGFSAALRKLLVKDATTTEQEVQQALRDPLTGFDRYAVIEKGLVAWTFETDGKPTPLDQVADLDDEAAEFIAVEIMRLTKPALFQTEDEREAASKNGIGASSSH